MCRVSTARERMIDAAERICAERGLAAMSLREVQAASRQRNKSAAQYHFGSRDGLIEAVVETRMAPINEHRLRLLAELDEDPSVRSLVEVLVRPLAEATLGRPDSRWARFLFQSVADPALVSVVRRSFNASGYRTTHDRLLDSLDHLPQELRDHRLGQVVGLTVMTLAVADRAAAAGEPAPLDIETRCADLIEVCCGLLLAPAPATEAAPQDQEAAC